MIGELPEQVPYLEWRHSAFARGAELPVVPHAGGRRADADLLGARRAARGPGRHTFLGGNFFMLRMLNRYRGELGVEALPHELEAAAHAHRSRSCSATRPPCRSPTRSATGGRLDVDVIVREPDRPQAADRVPVAPRLAARHRPRSRRARSCSSRAPSTPTGSIAGNDNDADAAAFEPHYDEIRSADQVQIYESVMGDVERHVTTGLLQASRYVKDNRLLPRGFDKATAAADIAVHGEAAADADFQSGGDRGALRD